MWPAATGESVLGIGYAMPYLRLWRDQSSRCIALTPAQMGAARWPPGVPNLSCAAEEDCLPFADLTFDRILMVHGLEMAENARRLLREVWRVLKDDGRLLIVAPNRTGMWAYRENTPFGHGLPYSTGQLGRLARQRPVPRRAPRGGLMDAAISAADRASQRTLVRARRAENGARLRRGHPDRGREGRIRRDAGSSGSPPPPGVGRSRLTPDQDIVHREVELDRLATAARVGRDMLIAEE